MIENHSSTALVQEAGEPAWPPLALLKAMLIGKQPPNAALPGMRDHDGYELVSWSASREAGALAGARKLGA